MRRFSLALLSLSFAAVAVPVAAQEPPAPCSTAEYRQLDFWVGEWDLAYDQPDGTAGTATNLITNDRYGPCVVVEEFAMPDGYRGTSYSIYDRDKRQWRQMWVDNRGATFTLVGGPVEGQPHSFELRTLEPTGPERLMRRMIWQDVTDDALVWRWQSLRPDGSWRDDWVLRYARRR